MDPLFLLFMFALFFLAGVGVGTFVLGSRIRKAEALLSLLMKHIENLAKADLNAVESKIKKAL